MKSNTENPLAPELVLLQEEISEAPDRAILDGDPELLKEYMRLLQRLNQ